MNIANDLFWLHILPALARCPPDILHFIREWITIFIIYRQDHHMSISYSQTENNWWKRQCMEWQWYIHVTCKQAI